MGVKASWHLTRLLGLLPSKLCAAKDIDWGSAAKSDQLWVTATWGL